jgi:hypothetical protein
MKRNIFNLLILLLLASCASGRKTPSHAELMKGAPSWVLQTPNHPMYYYGVGMAAKTPHLDHRERARQNALSELASSISVNISSSSVLNQFEADNSYSEFYRDNIRMSTEKFLQGYELVENWENDRQYWVYYRLSKTRYEQVKQEKINNALNLSLSKYEQAKLFSSQGRIMDALGFYVKSVEDIRDFLGEELKTDIQGEQKTYSTYLLSGIVNQLQSLNFDFQPLVQIKPGPLSPLAPVEVVVKDQDGRPVAGVPVVTRYSWLPGSFTESVTDSRGMFRVTPQGLAPGRLSETIRFNVDLRKITAGNSSDVMVQRLFSSFATSAYTLPVEIIPPICFVSVRELTVTGFNSDIISEEISNLLTRDGIELSASLDNSDYVIDSEITLVNQAQIGNRFTKNIRATFVLKDRNGTIRYNGRADNISGIGQSPAEAWEDAMKSLSGNIRISLYPNMFSNTFRK